jgi:hypothetical protein
VRQAMITRIPCGSCMVPSARSWISLLPLSKPQCNLIHLCHQQRRLWSPSWIMEQLPLCPLISLRPPQLLLWSGSPPRMMISKFRHLHRHRIRPPRLAWYRGFKNSVTSWFQDSVETVYTPIW